LSNQPRYRGNISKRENGNWNDKGDVALWDNEPEEDNQPILTGNLKKVTDSKEIKLNISLWDNEPEEDKQPDFSGQLQDDDYNKRGEIVLWINEDADENEPDITGKVTIYKGEDQKTYNVSLWINEDQ